MNPSDLTVCHWPQVPALPAPGQPVLVRVATMASRRVARVQLREATNKILAAWTGRAPPVPFLHETPHGPVCHEAIDGQAVRLSFSYSNDAAWVALLLGGSVGVDAMRPEAFAEMPSVARLFLGPRARSVIASSADPVRAFARAWTEHEATLKLAGRDLAEWRDDSAGGAARENASTERVGPERAAGVRLAISIRSFRRAHPAPRLYFHEDEQAIVAVAARCEMPGFGHVSPRSEAPECVA